MRSPEQTSLSEEELDRCWTLAGWRRLGIFRRRWLYPVTVRSVPAVSGITAIGSSESGADAGGDSGDVPYLEAEDIRAASQ